MKQVRRKADNIRRLLRKLGDTDEHRPLGDRFHRTQLRLGSGVADEVAANTFGRLGLAMHAFNLLLFKKFYTNDATAR